MNVWENFIGQSYSYRRSRYVCGQIRTNKLLVWVSIISSGHHVFAVPVYYILATIHEIHYVRLTHRPINAAVVGRANSFDLP